MFQLASDNLVSLRTSGVVTEHPGTVERQLEKLRRDFGEVFLAALADPETVEILLNSDGTLWQERLGEQPAQIGSMTISIKTTCSGSRSGGNANNSGSSVRPAMGTWTAAM